MFELYNIAGAETFSRIDSDAAEGKLSKSEFVTEMIQCESRAAEKTRAFYIRVFLPWAKEWRVPTHPADWFVARSDRSETLVLPFVSKTDAYWRNYENCYDAIVCALAGRKGQNGKKRSSWRPRRRNRP